MIQMQSLFTTNHGLFRGTRRSRTDAIIIKRLTISVFTTNHGHDYDKTRIKSRLSTDNLRQITDSLRQITDKLIHQPLVIEALRAIKGFKRVLKETKD